MSLAPPEIIEELEAIRQRLCQYGRDNVSVTRCDCKFYMAGSPNSEFSGCAELESLVRHLRGEETLSDRLDREFADRLAGGMSRRDYMNKDGHTYD